MMDGSDNSQETGKSANMLMDIRAGGWREYIEKSRHQILAYRWSLLFIWIPTIICAAYLLSHCFQFICFGGAVYRTDPSRMQAVGLSSLLQSSGISRAQDDVFFRSLISSCLEMQSKALEKQIDLRGVFNRPEADFFFALSSLIYSTKSEEFFRYYQRRVSVTYDSTTGISTLIVTAFRPEDAQLVAKLLLKESESLVNRLNERAHNNAVHDADIDVKLAEDLVTTAQQNVLLYRNRETTLDPGKASGAIFETAAKMQAELFSTQTRLVELDRNSPNSPLRSNLEMHARALTDQIDNLKGSLAGDRGSMASKISEYEQLILRQGFAEKELASAMASLESARAEARRQQIYLDHVVEANLPDKALFPKRIRSVLTVFVCLFLAYAIGKLLIAGIREHSQE